MTTYARAAILALLLLAGALPPAPAAAASAGRTVAPLRTLARQAEVIVLGQVAAVEAHDESRLRVYRLDVQRRLTDTGPTASVEIVEARGALDRLPYARAGARVVALLGAAPNHSYLARLLGRGDRFVLIADRDGLIPVDDEASLAAATRLVALGRGPAPDAVPARREAAFAALATRNTRLVGDALLELRDLPPPGALAAEEFAAVRTALADGTLHAGLRIALLDILAAHAVTAAIPALADAVHTTPDVLGAWLVARVRLGDLPDPAALAPYLAETDPHPRIAAVRALAWHPAPAALATLDRHTRTDTLAIRRAAVVELGANPRPDALPTLVTTFADPDRELQQASARALLAIDGPAVEQALITLALTGDTHRTRTYAAAILLTHRPPDHPAVRRLAASDPPPEVKRLLDEGLESSHSHGD